MAALFSEFGFPVLVTLYLLHRVEKKLDEVTKSIQELPTKLVQPPYHSYPEQQKSALH